MGHAVVLLVAFLTSSALLGADLVGRVIGVLDGDTITVLDLTNTQYRVRLAGIDAPEKGQPFGNRSKQNMSDLVFGKEVRVDWYKQDQYGRIVGNVWVNPADSPCQDPNCPKTLDAGLAQITVGLAWHYKVYADEQTDEDRQRYSFAEDEARAQKSGLWSEPNPNPPWEWRRSHPRTDKNAKPPVAQ